MLAPEFWHKDGLIPRLLSPLSAIWAWVAARAQVESDPYHPPVPVICVGNIITGGTGKTPVVLALIERLRAKGLAPHVLTRGYGGTEVGPRAVDIDRHDSARVGDEPLLLARKAPTWVARWRPDGAVAAVEMGADLLVMDDGFQNASVAKDLSIVVVDGGYGFGNGRVVPAGPCRESVAAGLARADAVVLIGEDTVGVTAQLGQLPILCARLVPGPEIAQLTGSKVVAFAGIGRPEKFFNTLRQANVRMVDALSFPDHHPFSAGEITELLAVAEAQEALLVTTAKDAVRVPSALRGRLTVVTVTLAWEDEAAVDALLERVLPCR